VSERRGSILSALINAAALLLAAFISAWATLISARSDQVPTFANRLPLVSHAPSQETVAARLERDECLEALQRLQSAPSPEAGRKPVSPPALHSDRATVPVEHAYVDDLTGATIGVDLSNPNLPRLTLGFPNQGPGLADARPGFSQEFHWSDRKFRAVFEGLDLEQQAVTVRIVEIPAD